MLRRIHSLPGLIAAFLVAVLAVTGAILSLDPMLGAGRHHSAQCRADQRGGAGRGGNGDAC